MAFGIRVIAAARDALATAQDNLKRYPQIASKINFQFIYLPDAEQDTITKILSAKMDDEMAYKVVAIFDAFTCSECGKVNRACHCKKAEMVA